MTRALDPARPAGPLLYVVNATWFFVSHRLVLARAARAAGHDVHLAAAPDPTVAEVEAAGITVHPLPLDRGVAGPARELASVRALDRLVAALRPSLIHNVTLKPVLYGSLVARRRRVPRVLNAITGLGTLHLARGPVASLRRQLVPGLLRAGCNRPGVTMIFQNPDDRAEYARAGIGLDAVLIPGSGVDLDAFHPAPEPAGRPVVLLAARLLRDKGVVEFVEAARRLRGAGVDAEFVLAGAIDSQNSSAVTARELDAWVEAGDVSWWGHRADMAEVLRRATVACLPSYREGLPKFLLEASATARAIVATDVPGCRDVVRDGETGLLVPVRDSGRLAGAIGQLLDDATLRQRLRLAARVRAEQEFSVGVVVQRHLDLYAGLGVA